jgi:hypothetical protein
MPDSLASALTTAGEITGTGHSPTAVGVCVISLPELAVPALRRNTIRLVHGRARAVRQVITSLARKNQCTPTFGR